MMSELISGKEARLAWANGWGIEYMPLDKWKKLGGSTPLSIFDRDDVKFRPTPETIMINGVKLEKPKAIEKPTVTSIILCFNSEPERNVFLNTLMNRNF